MKLFLAILLGLSGLVLSARADDPPLDFDWGIIITNCVRDTDGIHVRFISHNPPPFFVGAYPVYDYAEGGYIKEVVTSNCEAFIAGDFTDYPVNVKVLLASRIAEVTRKWSDFHRQLTKQEVEKYTANCRLTPSPDKTYRTYRVWGSDGYPIIYHGTLFVNRCWSVGYDDIIYTNNATAATTTISFSSTPVPSAVAGESNVLYWTQSTINVSPYNPANYDNWCLMSEGKWWPQYVMYKNGPLFRLESDPITNSTVEIYAGRPTIRVREIVPGDKMVLVRGEILSNPSIALPSFGAGGEPNYWSKPVTNVYTRYEYNYGWGLHPMPGSNPGEEIVWNSTGNRTNLSQAVYLPRLLKVIPSDGTQRVTTDYYGTAIIVTNTPTHWQTDFGVVDIPPNSNTLFRITMPSVTE